MNYQMREKTFAIGDDYWIETRGRSPCVQAGRQDAPHPQDARVGQGFELALERECALDAFYHPFAYAA